MKLQGYLVTLTAMVIFLGILGMPIGLNAITEGIGVSIDQDTGQVISADIESSSFWNSIFGGANGILIILGGAAVVAIGLFARGYDPSLIIIPFIVVVAGMFIPTFWAVIKYVMAFNQVWMTSIITIIFGALAVGFATACVSYFAGR